MPVWLNLIVSTQFLPLAYGTFFLLFELELLFLASDMLKAG